jgi:flagellar biosynthesis/type III secretory pathway M-ring protein FliF/YscJ
VQVVEYLVIFAILLAVVAFVSAPVRRALTVRSDETGDAHASELAELEAAREAKLRELRDAELDHRTGKLSDADYEELDQTLRGEAIAIMHDIDRATIDGQ